MSFGRPGGFSDLVNAPPDRGSFPLDHYGSSCSIPNCLTSSSPPLSGSGYVDAAGECKDFMKAYLSCLKKNEATSTPCRVLNRDYLECRMSKCVFRPALFTSRRR